MPRTVVTRITVADPHNSPGREAAPFDTGKNGDHLGEQTWYVVDTAARRVLCLLSVGGVPRSVPSAAWTQSLMKYNGNSGHEWELKSRVSDAGGLESPLSGGGEAG